MVFHMTVGNFENFLIAFGRRKREKHVAGKRRRLHRFSSVWRMRKWATAPD